MKREVLSHVNWRASVKTTHQRKKLEFALDLDKVLEVYGRERKMTMSVA